MLVRTVMAAGLALWPGLALAQQADVGEVVVTAPLEGARSESLQGAFVANRQEVVDNLIGGLGEVLDHAPGVSSSFYGAGASRPIIRGLGDDRVRVLQNGVGAIDAASASPDHAVTSDGLDAERIEVLRGAAALAYGGNAIGGVVNVIDQSIPTRAPENGREVDTFAALSSVNDGREGSLGATLGAGAFAVHLDAAARETGDYEIPGFANADGTGANGVAPNSYTSTRSFGAGGSALGDWGFAGVAIKQFETEYGLPPGDPSEAGGHIELEQTRVETRGDVRFSAGPFRRLDWGAQHSDYAHTEFESDGAAGTTFRSEGYEARLEAHNAGWGDRLTGAVGVQLSDVDFGADGEEKFIDPTNTRDAGLFVIQRWDTGRGGFEGGARFEQRELSNAMQGDRDFNATSVSLSGFVRPAEGWFVGVTLARTERAPTAVELFAEGPHLATGVFERGDAALGVETANSLEASARYRSDGLALEANLYRMDFDGYIALAPTAFQFNLTRDTEDLLGTPPVGPDDEILPIFAFVQQDASFVGGELSADKRLFEGSGWEVRADAAVDWVEASFDAGGNVPRTPPRTITLGLTGISDALTLRVEGLDLADQDDIAAFETPTGGSTLLNARATWRPFESRDIALILDGRNLTDEESRVHTSFLKDVLPRPGRSLRLALTAAF